MPIPRTASKLQAVFAMNLRKLRRDNQLTQAALAREVGINRTHLLQLENCNYYATLNTIERLAEALQVEPAILLRYPSNVGASSQAKVRVPQSASSRIDLQEVFAANLRKFRASKDWTRDDLAREASVSPSYLQQIETCLYNASIKIIERLANALQVEPYALLKLENSFQRRPRLRRFRKSVSR